MAVVAPMPSMSESTAVMVNDGVLRKERTEKRRSYAKSRIQRANHRTGRKYGDYAWRVAVPANGTGQLTFRLRVPYEDPPEDE